MKKHIVGPKKDIEERGLKMEWLIGVGIFVVLVLAGFYALGRYLAWVAEEPPPDIY